MDPRAKEGDLYKELHAFGKTFALYYGYYDEIERHSKYGEPIPIYPDFRAEPQYTDDGKPFVTEMQDACSHYSGKDRDDGCRSCRYYERGEEFLGVCVCKKNRMRRNE